MQAMLGLEPQEMRPLLHEYMAIVMQLLTTDEPVNYESDRLKLGRCTPAPASVQPAAIRHRRRRGGPRRRVPNSLANMALVFYHSGATVAVGMDVLAHHWTIQEEVATAHGQVADRDKWRLVGLMHLAESKEEARRDVEYGIEQWFRYFQNVAAFPQMAVDGGNIDEMVDFVNGGLGVVGTPDMAIAQIEELLEQSNGGFGAYLTLAHNWANQGRHPKRATSCSPAMSCPTSRAQLNSTIQAAERAQASRPELADKQMVRGRGSHCALRGRKGPSPQRHVEAGRYPTGSPRRDRPAARR